MDLKKFLLSSIMGCAALFLLGYLFYAVLLVNFFENNAGTVIGARRTEPHVAALIVGNLAYAAFLAFVFLKWAGISGLRNGLRGGLVIGLFSALTFGFISYATSNALNMNGTLVDALVWTVMSTIAGGVVGAIIKRV